MPAYVLLTDAPPLKEDGHGCHVLAWNLVQILGADLKLVVTHRLNPVLSLEKIASDLAIPSVFYPDLARVRWLSPFRAIKSLVELFLVFLTVSRLARAIKTSGANRIFSFFGGNASFLWITWLVARKTGLPLDIYLVDDLEESARLNGPAWSCRLIRWLEPKILRTAQRIFVISPRYGEHLQTKYGIQAHWLPVPFLTESVAFCPHATENSSLQHIAFMGAVNPLYLSGLKELLVVLKEWNTGAAPFQLKVIIMTYTDPQWISQELKNYDHWELRSRRSIEECRQTMREAWAIFLPESFDVRIRKMVETSFPSRLAEVMTAGRPLLVYGPPYASLIRYFSENALPICVQSQSTLRLGLEQIKKVDSSALIGRYQTVLLRHHSRAAIRARLQKGPA